MTAEQVPNSSYRSSESQGRGDVAQRVAVVDSSRWQMLRIFFFCLIIGLMKGGSTSIRWPHNVATVDYVQHWG